MNKEIIETKRIIKYLISINKICKFTKTSNPESIINHNDLNVKLVYYLTRHPNKFGYIEKSILNIETLIVDSIFIETVDINNNFVNTKIYNSIYLKNDIEKLKSLHVDLLGTLREVAYEEIIKKLTEQEINSVLLGKHEKLEHFK